jgi:hypothetical protein
MTRRLQDPSWGKWWEKLRRNGGSKPTVTDRVLLDNFVREITVSAMNQKPILDASLQLAKCQQTPEVFWCCVDIRVLRHKIFFESPVTVSQHRRLCAGANQPPLIHRSCCSPSAQVPSLSSSDEPIMPVLDQLSCCTFFVTLRR